MSEPMAGTAVARALVELRDLRTRLDTAASERHAPIAVIGLGCRLPGGVRDPDAFWDLLLRGAEATREVPADRWDLSEFYDPDPSAPGKMSTRYGAFLDGLDEFDHAFFGISPREAASMDPQQRLVLEVAWEALEHAGVAPDSLSGEAGGIFIGASATDYLQLLLRRSDASLIDPYVASGGALSVIAGRLAFFLGTRGPALVVDTACSSSLVALHQACRSLRLRESRIAIAAGVSTMLVPELSVNFSQARMLSADGRCKAFDAAADGYGRGEGCGAVVLKRLSDAVADRDRILAVIRGSAVNQDGRSSGLTVPNADAQHAVVGAALADARVAPGDIDYVEAHGTGTPLGDPIEVRALARSLGADRPADAPLLVGSVKTNLGHLEAAAGIVGVIKVVLALERGALPASLHFKTPSPHVNWSELPVRVVDRTMPWVDGQRPRRAGVSSFGFSGTNAHVVLESAPSPCPPPPDRAPRLHVLPLSARTAAGLRMLADRYVRHLQDHPGIDLADACWTAAVGRAHFGVRMAVTGRTVGEIVARLSDVTAGEHAAAAPPSVAFAFAGQGAGGLDLGADLYALCPVFRNTVDHCNGLLARLPTPTAAVLVRDDPSGADVARAQPSLFVLEYALAQLWQSWGLRPAAVVGHSLGEFTAACVAGAMDLADALRLVVARGRLAAALPTGAMAAVLADEGTVLDAIHGRPDVVVAALNGPANTVISGTVRGVEAVSGVLAARGIECRQLPVSRAFHSPDVDAMLDAFERECAAVQWRAPAIPWASTATGRVVGVDEVPSAAYWRRQAREPVRFADAIGALGRAGVTHCLEIGPGAALSASGRRVRGAALHWLPSLGGQRGAWDQLATSLARLYRDGAAIDWRRVAEGQPGAAVAMPTYPFDRHRHWMAGDRPRATARPGDVARRWDQISAAAGRQADAAPFDLDLRSFGAKWDALARLSLAAMESTLGRLNAFPAARQVHSVDSLLAACGILPSFRALVCRWLRRLADSGRLDRDEERYVSRAGFATEVAPGLHAEVARQFADYPEWLRYFDACTSRLDGVLLGRVSPLDTLFPGGRVDLAAGLYETSPVARYFNAIVAAAVGMAAGSHPPSRMLRILEIGAGTGGTTAALLPMLDPDRTEYVFSDVGSWFLRRAEVRFADVPFLRCQALDIEEPGPEWRSGPAFDLIVAANVLHATRDLPATLAHVRRLLTPGGLLVAVETTDHPVWLDVTTGLIAGWQRFDDGWREDSPLLGSGRWLDLLADAGFGHRDVQPAPGSPAAILGQHVLLAQALDATTRAADPAAVARVVPAREVAAAAAPQAGVGDPHRLTEFVRAEVMAVLRLPAAETPSRHQRLVDLGLDSLMAVELRDRLARVLDSGHALPATLVFDYPTIAAIAEYLSSQMEVAPGATPPGGSRLAEHIADLDDRAVADLVDARLRTL